MDVTSSNFYHCLPDILLDISEAHFVAIDLELSGVPTKKRRQTSGKPSLQERYLETKEAAEKYQILQIGITCAKQDFEHEKYVLKPYNFDLSPIIQEHGLDVERIFSFQSGAAEFLLGVGFDIGRPFREGVPYLSRAESKDARQKFASRQDKSALPDILIKPTDTESLAFLDCVRASINNWLKRPDLKFLSIGPGGLGYTGDDLPEQELGRFERRLVHQVVRAEYPELITITRRGCITVQRFDKEREDRIHAERNRDLEERISRQKGFRWIIEALHGGPIDKIDYNACTRVPWTPETAHTRLDQVRAKIQRAQSHVQSNPRVLVGHNCFLDLIYIYNTFVGQLPDTVEEFALRLHKMWPTIVDTKYLSTHNCGDINPVSALEQIALQLSEQQQPLLEIAEGYDKYAEVEAYHEAGYDSFLTAQIMIRLSSKLFREGNYSDFLKPDPEDIISVINGVANLQSQTTIAAAETGFVPSIVGEKWVGKGDSTIATSNGSNSHFKYDPRRRQHKHVPLDGSMKIDGGMPRFKTEFWHTYSNKLRVFGTEEAVCILDDNLIWWDPEMTSPVDTDASGGVRLE